MQRGKSKGSSQRLTGNSWSNITHGLRNEFCLISEVIFDRLSHHGVCLTVGKFLSWASKKARGLNALMKPIYILSATRCASRGHQSAKSLAGILGDKNVGTPM